MTTLRGIAMDQGRKPGMLTFASMLIALLLSSCASNAPQSSAMLLKARYQFADSSENASYCLLQRLAESYPNRTSTVDQTAHGWDIRLRADQRVLFVLSMSDVKGQKTLGELFLPEGDMGNTAWIGRITSAALPCKGKPVY
ncbi:hypothetical protein [Methylovorus glucosotrophus]|nr:hypothetical protein [Methylovorus glucosotrophus]